MSRSEFVQGAARFLLERRSVGGRAAILLVGPPRGGKTFVSKSVATKMMQLPQFVAAMYTRLGSNQKTMKTEMYRAQPVENAVGLKRSDFSAWSTDCEVTRLSQVLGTRMDSWICEQGEESRDSVILILDDYDKGRHLLEPAEYAELDVLMGRGLVVICTCEKKPIGGVSAERNFRRHLRKRQIPPPDPNEARDIARRILKDQGQLNVGNRDEVLDRTLELTGNHPGLISIVVPRVHGVTGAVSRFPQDSSRGGEEWMDTWGATSLLDRIWAGLDGAKRAWCSVLAVGSESRFEMVELLDLVAMMPNPAFYSNEIGELREKLYKEDYLLAAASRNRLASALFEAYVRETDEYIEVRRKLGFTLARDAPDLSLKVLAALWLLGLFFYSLLGLIGVSWYTAAIVFALPALYVAARWCLYLRWWLVARRVSV